VSPLFKTRHRLRNRCHHSLTKHNTGATSAIQPQHQHTSPPPQKTASLTTLTCAIHSPPQHLLAPATTDKISAFPNSTQQWQRGHRCLPHHPSQPVHYHHPNTSVRHSTSNTTHSTTPQDQWQPSRNTTPLRDHHTLK